MVVTGYFSQQVRRAFHALPPITISDPDLTLIESATAGGKRPSTVLHAELTHCTAISFKTSSEWQRVGSMELAFLDGVDEEKKQRTRGMTTTNQYIVNIGVNTYSLLLLSTYIFNNHLLAKNYQARNLL